MATEIVTLVEVKAHLSKTSSSDDTELLGFIAAAEPIVEFYVGPVIDATITERHSGFIALRRLPAKTLTSVTAVYTAGTSWNVADLDLDTESGIVTRLDGGALYGGPWEVVYTVGRTTVDDNIKVATKIIVKHLWETQRGSMPRLGMDGGDVLVQPGVSYAVPRRALELLRPDTAASGIA